jgi:hypothetical protein
MKCATVVGSDATICIPRFIQIGSAIQKFIGGINSQKGNIEIAVDLLLLLQDLQDKDSRLTNR